MHNQTHTHTHTQKHRQTHRLSAGAVALSANTLSGHYIQHEIFMADAGMWLRRKILVVRVCFCIHEQCYIFALAHACECCTHFAHVYTQSISRCMCASLYVCVCVCVFVCVKERETGTALCSWCFINTLVTTGMKYLLSAKRARAAEIAIFTASAAASIFVF